MSTSSITDNLAIMGDPAGVGTSPGAMDSTPGTYVKRQSDGSIKAKGAGLVTTNVQAAGQLGGNNLQLAGAAVSASATLTATSAGVQEVNAASGAVSLTLPLVSTVSGQMFELVKIDPSGNAAGFAPNGTDNINGANAPVSTTAQWGVIRLRANQAGTAWYNA